MKKRSWVAGLGCLATVGFCCVSSGALLGIGAYVTGRVEPAKVACDGLPVEGAGARPEGAEAVVLGFERGVSDGWVVAMDELPGSWNQASSAAEAQIILCLEDTQERTIETCPYDSGIVVHRIRRSQEVRLVEAATGETLHDVQLLGELPEPCPSSVSSAEVYGVNVSTRDREQRGATISARDLDRLLGGFVRGGELELPGAAPEAPADLFTALRAEASRGEVMVDDADSLHVVLPPEAPEAVQRRVQEALATAGWETVPGSLTNEDEVSEVLRELGLTEAAAHAQGATTWGGSFSRGGATIAVEVERPTGTDDIQLRASRLQ